jgi:hypothetical protein
MNMAPARKVTYLDLQTLEGGTSVARAAATAAPARSGRTGLSGVVANVMDLTAGEAQVLLVGDVGLTASR